jgi:NADH-ubiquinone oxidoreductase chain 5
MGSVICGFAGRKIGVKGSQIISCLSILITTFLAINVFLEVGMTSVPTLLKTFRWIDCESLFIL